MRLPDALLAWAKGVDRPLPWRGERDPYRVLVSEVMLQQTQWSRVVPAYESFLVRFPTIEALAEAPAADVIREWGTLGYPRRALNVHRAARAIVARGSFPRSVDELLTLPGVGPYTASAVASFAFNADEVIVEANVKRIFTRLQLDPAPLLPRGRSAEWNQALMDLGEMVCRPRKPRCDECPVRRWCSWTETPVQRKARVPFAKTNRYARGRVVRALRESSVALSKGRLASITGLERGRLDEALRGLIDDELVVAVRRRYALPQ